MLINSFQIETNLRRTASKGYISLLSHEVLENLAFKYFGIKDEYGNIIGYQCPYSGEVYTDYRNIVLEHIIPVGSKGGTVLFNCIPTSSGVNKVSEKGAKHLITWWTNSKYWNTNATLRLEKLVNYMLEAYEKVFEEHTLEELENSYLDFDLSEEITIDDDLELSEQQESLILKKQGEQNGIHSYLGFILSCIETLEKYNVNTIEIRSKLKDLENKHIFENIDRFQLFQNLLQQVIIKRLGDDNRSYLTYLLKFDIKKLMDSIEYQKQDEIYNEIDLRLKNIENILKEKNLSIKDYFKNVDDITDIDIIYKKLDNISKYEVQEFIGNIKLGIDTKIDIFIKMLNDGNELILKQRNKETFEGYPNVKISNFWNKHKDRIKQKLFVELRDNSKYDVARKIIYNFSILNSLEKQILIFIEMLNQGNSNILKNGNIEVLDGYPNIKLSNFWSNNREKIKQKLFVELKDNLKYEAARKLIEIHEMVINIDSQIPIFIEMLNRGNSNILKSKSKATLDGYPSIKLFNFWNRHKDRIKQKLFDDLKDNPEYETARKLIEIHEMTIDIYQQISIFIEMLNRGNSNILTKGNRETLDGYPNIKLSNFWCLHQSKIVEKLFVELKGNPKYDKARKLIEINEISINVDKQIPIFIEMLNQGNSNILKSGNKETLDGYPDIKLSNFWHRHKDRIKQKLFTDLKDNSKYDIARRLVEMNEVSINVDKQIPIFIEMLNQGNSNILKSGNKETLDGYPDIKLYQFWHSYKSKIINMLFTELKDNSKYDKARKLVEMNEVSINVDKQIPIFIEMLNQGNNNILKQGNKETLEGYPNIKLAYFWGVHQEKIKQKLFVELMDDSNYTIARELILGYEVRNNIDIKINIFIEMLNQGNGNILIKGNKETLEGYPDIKLSQFWQSHKEKIKQKLFTDLKDNSKYDTARKLVEMNDISVNLEKQVLIYIEMLNQGNSNILKSRNKEILSGYPNIKLAFFWNNNKTRIKQKLFLELNDNPDYNKARKTVLNYYKVNSYEEYLEKERKSKELKELKKMKKQLESVDDALTRKENVVSRKRA